MTVPTKEIVIDEQAQAKLNRMLLAAADHGAKRNEGSPSEFAAPRTGLLIGMVCMIYLMCCS